MKTNQGSVVLYIILLMFVMMTSAAVVLSGILSKHIRSSENYLTSEQSFAAANSSIEHMLFQIAKGGATGEVTSKGSITYNPGATNQFEIVYDGAGCNKNGTPYLTASGTYKSVVRRINFGGGRAGNC